LIKCYPFERSIDKTVDITRGMRMNASDERRRIGLGKVSREVLERSVFPYLPMSDIPRLDGGVIRCQGEVVIAHSPSAGLYLPVGSEEGDLEIIAISLGDEAKRYGVTVVAGQTAAYAGIEAPFVTATCLGERVGTRNDPAPGDVVYFIGAVGGEAVWLKDLSQGIASDKWKTFTPLPIMRRLQLIDDVTSMHDVSEGGVKRALLELSEGLGVRLNLATYDVRLAEGVLRLAEDPLRLPSYGTMVVLTRSGAAESVEEACMELDAPCSRVGVVEAGQGLIVDGEKVVHLDRVNLDRLYGSFRDP
jgi:hydrogenase maturation factor